MYVAALVKAIFRHHIKKFPDSEDTFMLFFRNSIKKS